MIKLTPSERRSLALVAAGSVSVGLTKFEKLHRLRLIEIKRNGWRCDRYHITERGLAEHRQQLEVAQR